MPDDEEAAAHEEYFPTTLKDDDALAVDDEQPEIISSGCTLDEGDSSKADIFDELTKITSKSSSSPPPFAKFTAELFSCTFFLCVRFVLLPLPDEDDDVAMKLKIKA